MHLVTMFFSLSLGSSTLAFSDFSIDSLLSPLGNGLDFLTHSRNYPSSTCGLEPNSGSVNNSTQVVTNYVVRFDHHTDVVDTSLKGTPFGKGFIKYSCHPNPRVEEEEPFCIFSNPDINQGAGMSVISKPATFSETLEFILDFSEDPDPSDTFNVVPMPEKGGVGVLAAHRLARGDVVVNSLPILLTSVEPFTYDRPDWPQIQKLAIDLLPIETRKRVASLYGRGESEVQTLSNAIDMNSFEIELGLNEDVPFFAVFLKPSQLNHDCRPNTSFYIDSRTLQVHMHALRTITPGEEMTISYRDTLQPRADRQEELSDYGFKCSCNHCRMSDAEAGESDKRIHRIHELTETLSDWKDVRNKTILKEADELVDLYLLENLNANTPDGYTLASLTYNSFGYTSRARWYAAKAIEVGLLSHGPKWEELDTLGEILEDPEEHWSHRARLLLKTESPQDV